jgi:hypothetical protein
MVEKQSVSSRFKGMRRLLFIGGGEGVAVWAKGRAFSGLAVPSGPGQTTPASWTGPTEG